MWISISSCADRLWCPNDRRGVAYLALVFDVMAQRTFKLKSSDPGRNGGGDSLWRSGYNALNFLVGWPARVPLRQFNFLRLDLNQEQSCFQARLTLNTPTHMLLLILILQIWANTTLYHWLYLKNESWPIVKQKHFNCLLSQWYQEGHEPKFEVTIKHILPQCGFPQITQI